MPTLKTCLDAAVSKKEIERGDADRISALYNAYRRKAADNMGEGMAAAEAKRQLAELLKAETEHQKRKAKLGISSIRRIAADLDA